MKKNERKKISLTLLLFIGQIYERNGIGIAMKILLGHSLHIRKAAINVFSFDIDVFLTKLSTKIQEILTF